MTKEQIDTVLREINSRIPKEWQEGVVKAQEITPTMSFIIDKALEDANISDEKKKELQSLKDAGYFSKKKYQDDPVIAGKINNFVNREIKKAVKEGRLPTKRKLKELQAIWNTQKENSSKA